MLSLRCIPTRIVLHHAVDDQSLTICSCSHVLTMLTNRRSHGCLQAPHSKLNNPIQTFNWVEPVLQVCAQIKYLPYLLADSCGRPMQRTDYCAGVGRDSSRFICQWQPSRTVPPTHSSICDCQFAARLVTVEITKMTLHGMMTVDVQSTVSLSCVKSVTHDPEITNENRCQYVYHLYW